MKVAFYTIGCKLNQFETEVLKELCEKEGWEVVPFREKADVYVINTCTVTQQADAKSRQNIRRALKNNPKAIVVAVGCYPQVASEEVKATGAHIVLGTQDKYRIIEAIKEFLKQKEPITKISPIKNEFIFTPIEDFTGYSRAFVKVQEGCNRNCSYCLVKKARGPVRSAKPEDVIEEVKRLAEKGFEEIVLTGTHLGAYGEDRDTNLLKLLERLVEIPDVKKIRLSSIEPTELTKELIELITQHPKIAKHLHIPLQSGSDRILKLMNRPYTSSYFEELIHKIVDKNPIIGIGVDVIVGFPTETEEDFNLTYQLLKRLPIYYMHIFSYSPRRGTPAYHMKPQVRPDIKKQRWEALNTLKSVKKAQFVSKFVGKTLEGIVEGRPAEKGYWSGLTENYIPLLIEGNYPHLTGKVKQFKILTTKKDKAVVKIQNND